MPSNKSNLHFISAAFFILFLIASFILTAVNPLYSDQETEGPGTISFDDAKYWVEITTGGEWFYGYTLYQIGGYATFPDGSTYDFPDPMSQIKYPLNTFLATLEVDFRFAYNFEASLNLKTSVTPDSGKTEDSDWGVAYVNGVPGASPTTLDIFSTSDTSLNFYSFETSFFYRFLHDSGFSISAGIGFMLQYFYFDISNLDQYYPSSPGTAHDKVPGDVSTYTLWNSIFYGGMKFGYSAGFFKIQALAGFSPFAYGADYDVHLLVNKYSFANSSGTTYLARLDLSFYFTDNIFMKLNGSFMYITASGTQNQYSYEIQGQYTPMVTIDYRLQSEQLTAGVEVGFAF